MGGHGGLNILPQKRWNVYRRDNRLRVRRDEEQHFHEQQHVRQEDERRRMRDVLTLLKRKKAAAQAIYQQSHRFTDLDVHLRFPGALASSTSDGVLSSGSRGATTLRTTKVSCCSSAHTVGKIRMCKARAWPGRSISVAANCEGRDFSLTDGLTSFSQPSRLLVSSGHAARDSAHLANAEGKTQTPQSGGSLSTEVRESTCQKELLDCVDDPVVIGSTSVVRVRLPMAAYPSVVSEKTSPAKFPLVDIPFQSTSPLANTTTWMDCVHSGGGQETDEPHAEKGEEKKPNCLHATPADNSPLDHVMRVTGKGRHVNFFEVEEKEVNKLELQRKKYLQQAGHTPGARSEFDTVVRRSLMQTPWYYKPPSSSSSSTSFPCWKMPSVSFPLRGKEHDHSRLAHTSQHPVVQHITHDSMKAAVMQQYRAAAEKVAAAVLAGQEGGSLKEYRGIEGGAFTFAQPNTDHVAHVGASACSAARAAEIAATEGQQVQSQVQLEGEAVFPALLETEDARLRQNGRSRRKGLVKEKKEHKVSLKRHARENKRGGKNKQKLDSKKKLVNEVECLQVLLLVEGEEEEKEDGKNGGGHPCIDVSSSDIESVAGGESQSKVESAERQQEKQLLQRQAE